MNSPDQKEEGFQATIWVWRKTKQQGTGEEDELKYSSAKENQFCP